MYQPPHFPEDDLDTQHALIRAHPLGLLVTAGAGGLMANAVPFLVDRDGPPLGTLRAHVARANPQWQAIRDGAEVLVDRKSTRLNSSHSKQSRMPSSA